MGSGVSLRVNAPARPRETCRPHATNNLETGPVDIFKVPTSTAPLNTGIDWVADRQNHKTVADRQLWPVIRIAETVSLANRHTVIHQCGQAIDH